MINTPQNLDGKMIQDSNLKGTTSSGQLSGAIGDGTGSLFGMLTNKGVINTETSSASNVDGVLNNTSGMEGELHSGIIKENDYNKLINKPQINDVELKGNKTLEELGIQMRGNYTTQIYVDNEIERVESMIEIISYVHEQNIPSKIWIISHGLNRYPSVTVADSAMSIVYGEVEYIDSNNLIIYFNGAFSGKALLN